MFAGGRHNQIAVSVNDEDKLHQFPQAAIEQLMVSMEPRTHDDAVAQIRLLQDYAEYGEPIYAEARVPLWVKSRH